MRFTEFIDTWLPRAGRTAVTLIAAALAYFVWPIIAENEVYLGIYQGGCAVFAILFLLGFIVDIWRGRYHKMLYVVGLTAFWPVVIPVMVLVALVQLAQKR